MEKYKKPVKGGKHTIRIKPAHCFWQKLGGNKTMLIGDTIEYFYNLGPDYYNIASAISLILMVLIMISLFNGANKTKIRAKIRESY